MTAILELGDVVLPVPAYPGYEPIIKLMGASVEIDTTDNHFTSPEALEKAIEEQDRVSWAVILNHPAN